MKKISFIIAVLLYSATVFAQSKSNASALEFDHTEWNFGTIEEANGPATHVFEFVNTAKEPLVLERVITSCGCTTPNYSRQPIRPGQKGSIEIVYDPSNRPGRFEKSIDIISGGGKNRNTLFILGVVNPRPRTVEDDFPYLFGEGVRGEVAHRAFGYLAQGQTKSMIINLINTSDKAARIELSWGKRSGLLDVVVPEEIAAGKKATVTLTYDLQNKEHYGMLSDQLKMQINGKDASLPITTTATAVDDFKNVVRSKAPKINLAPAFLNFGKISGGEELEKEITISNGGESPLIIRNVETRDNVEFDLEPGTVILPRQDITVTLKFNTSKADYGAVFGSTAIISNDPDRPLRELRVSATIE